MHELGIASSILECVQKEAAASPRAYFQGRRKNRRAGRSRCRCPACSASNASSKTQIIEVSSTTGEGLDQWMNWLERSREAKKAAK